MIGAHILKGEKVVELRNPWGHGEWSGDWSDNSKKWTKALKDKYHKKGAKDDGRFFMPFDRYYKHYTALHVCYYKKQNTLSSFHDELDNNFVGCYKVEVTKGGEYYFVLSQEDWNAFYHPNLKKGKKKHILTKFFFNFFSSKF